MQSVRGKCKVLGFYMGYYKRSKKGVLITSIAVELSS